MISIGNKVFTLQHVFFIVLCGFLSSTLYANDTPPASPGDSLNKPVFVITPRLNSTGHFPFSGSLINQHLNADINFFYSARILGFFIFKSYDIVDPHSFVNYLQPGVFATLHLHDDLRLRAFFGYIFSQTNGFRDDDSDYYAALSMYWDVTDHVRVEHTALYYDYTINKKLANRFLLTWQSEKFKVNFYLWHRYVFDDNAGALSSSLALTFPSIRLAKNVLLQFTSSYLGYITEAKPDYAMRDGFLFTIAAPIDVK